MMVIFTQVCVSWWHLRTLKNVEQMASILKSQCTCPIIAIFLKKENTSRRVFKDHF